MSRWSIITLLTLTAAAFSGPSAHALIGVNHCGPGISPPDGLQCASDHLLLGYRDPSGPCHWVCCPPNSDGRTYDCSGAPTASDFKIDLRNVLPQEWQELFTPSAAPESAEPTRE